MKIETLKERIEKATAKIEKKQNTIVKKTAQIEKKRNFLEKLGFANYTRQMYYEVRNTLTDEVADDLAHDAGVGVAVLLDDFELHAVFGAGFFQAGRQQLVIPVRVIAVLHVFRFHALEAHAVQHKVRRAVQGHVVRGEQQVFARGIDPAQHRSGHGGSGQGGSQQNGCHQQKESKHLFHFGTSFPNGRRTAGPFEYNDGAPAVFVSAIVKFYGSGVPPKA